MSQKSLIYKWGSVGLLAIDVLMLLLCPFYAVASEVASLLGGGAGLIGELFGGSMSDSTSKIIEQIGSGKCTLLQAQKALYSLCDAFSSYSDELQTACTILTVFMIVIYAFIVVCVVEAVLHVLGKKLNGIALIVDIVMSIMAALLIWEVNGSFQQYSSGDLFHNTFWAYIIMILPLFSTLFWRKYKKLQNAGDQEYAADGTQKKPLIDFRKWKAYLAPNKVAAIIIAVVYVLEILFGLMGVAANPVLRCILWLLIGLTVGIGVIYAYCRSYMMLKFLAIVSLIGGLFSVGIYGYGATSFLFRWAFTALTVLLLYLLADKYNGEYKLPIMAGCAGILDLVLILFSQYLSVYNFVFFIFEVIGMAVPVGLFLCAPDVLRQMNLMPVNMKVVRQESAPQAPRQVNAAETIKNTFAAMPKLADIPTQIKENENAIGEDYIALGQMYCLSAPSRDGLDADTASALDQAEDLLVKNSALKEQMDQVSVSSVCPNCGQVNEQENAFCVHCGTPIPAVSVEAGDGRSTQELEAEYKKNDLTLQNLFLKLGQYYYGRHEVYYKLFQTIPPTEAKKVCEDIIHKTEKNKKLYVKLEELKAAKAAEEARAAEAARLAKEAEEARAREAARLAKEAEEARAREVARAAEEARVAAAARAAEEARAAEVAKMSEPAEEEEVPVTSGPLFCTQCGFRLEAGSRFCSNCGTPVED